ncbi:MAG: hypothetical protein SFU86_01715 [Pirellulaceae bacterium]|nr:hypothetical protein [Pirellulaceae bacterium]
MADLFNPYREWLGIPEGVESPSYYQLLGVGENESAAVISVAADRAASKVRSFRPGTNAQAWSKLLDEIHAARVCLLDGAKRAEYDRQRYAGASQSPPAESTPPTEAKAAGPLAHQDFYPPGMKPPSIREPAAKPAASSILTPPTDDLLPPPANRPVNPAPLAELSPPTPPVASPSAYQPPSAPYTGGYGTGPMTPVAGPMTPLPAPAAPQAWGASPADAMPPQPYGMSMPAAMPAAYPSAPYSPPQAPYPGMGSYPAAMPTSMPMAMPMPGGPMQPMGMPGMPSPGTPMAGMPMAGMHMPGTMPTAMPMGMPGMGGYGLPIAQPMAPYDPMSAGMNPYGMPTPPPAPPPLAEAMSPPALGSFSGGMNDPMAPMAMGPMALGPMTPVPPEPGGFGGAIPAPSPYSSPSGIPVGSAMPVGQSAPVGTAIAPKGATRSAAPSTLASSVSSGPAVKANMAEVMAARREDQMQRNLLIGGVAVALVAMTAGFAYLAMSGGTTPPTVVESNPELTNPETTNPTPTDVPPAQPIPQPPRPLPMPSPIPDKPRPPHDSLPMPPTVVPPQPTPMPMPAPMPAPMPSPTPMPEIPPPPKPPEPTSTPTPTPSTPTPTPPTPAPTPTPPPPPMPAPPEPAVKPTRDELVALGKLLTSAKAAIGEQNFDDADKDIAKAEPLAKLPEHKAKVARLKEIVGLVRQFRNALKLAVEGLNAGESFKVGTSTQVVVVETFSDRIIVRTAGQNRNYPFAELPPGLAVALADFKLDQADPVSRVVKGAYVATSKRSDSAALEKAKTWWEEAQLGGADVSHLMPFLTDSYDLEKE